MSKETFDDTNTYDPELFSYKDYDEKQEEKECIQILEGENPNKMYECIDDNNSQNDKLKIDYPIEKFKREAEKEEAEERRFDKFTSE